MEVFQDVKGSSKQLEFVLKGTRYQYANTLRRAIMTLVDTVAFRSDPPGVVLESPDIKIIKNDSNTQPNELLAHRISLLPIHNATPESWDPERYVFKLEMMNQSSEPLDVTAANITVFERRKGADMTVNLVEIPGRDFFPPNPKTQDTCIITTLPGKRSDALIPTLLVEMRATVGNGREHSRFIPTCQASYSYTQDTNTQRRNAYFEKWLATHKNVTDIEALKKDAEKRGEFEREFKSMQIQRVYLVDEKGDPNSFDFQIETIGTLAPRMILEKALLGILSICDKFTRVDVGELPASIRLVPSDTLMSGYDFLIQGQDYTFGNMIQTWLVDHHVDGEEKPAIVFAGFKVPHPLKDELLLRIGVEDNSEVTARAALAAAARGCKAMFEGWLQTWRGGKPASTAKTASTAAAGRTVFKLKKTPTGGGKTEAMSSEPLLKSALKK